MFSISKSLALISPARVLGRMKAFIISLDSPQSSDGMAGDSIEANPLSTLSLSYPRDDELLCAIGLRFAIPLPLFVSKSCDTDTIPSSEIITLSRLCVWGIMPKVNLTFQLARGYAPCIISERQMKYNLYFRHGEIIPIQILCLNVLTHLIALAPEVVHRNWALALRNEHTTLSWNLLTLGSAMSIHKAKFKIRSHTNLPMTTLSVIS